MNVSETGPQSADGWVRALEVAEAGGRVRRVPPQKKAALVDADPHLVSVLRPDSWDAEPYRALAHALERLQDANERKVLAVTSSAAGEGKTTTSINLAATLAERPGAKVLLIDADFRRSAVAQHLGFDEPSRPGLIQAISDERFSLENVLWRRPPMRFAVLPAGSQAAAPYETIESPRVGVLIEEARRRFDFVIVDTPPMGPVADSLALQKWVDGFLLVVAANMTPRRLLEDTLGAIEPKKLIGLIFNRGEGMDPYYRRYYAPYEGPAVEPSP